MLYQLSYLPQHSCTYVTITHDIGHVNWLPSPSGRLPAGIPGIPAPIAHFDKTYIPEFSLPPKVSYRDPWGVGAREIARLSIYECSHAVGCLGGKWLS